MREQDYKLVIKVLLAILTVLIIAVGYFCVSLTEAYGVIESQKEDIEQIKVEISEFATTLETSYDTLHTKYEEVVKENEELTLEIEELKAPKYKYDLTEDEIYLLAQCVEAEAGIGNTDSQKYVTQVILNRLYTKKGYPNTLKGVIYHKTAGNVPQFSVAYDGSMEGRVVKEETLENVRDVLKNGTDLPGYVFFFYSNKVTNNWVNSLNTYKVVDGTVFAYASKEC